MNFLPYFTLHEKSWYYYDYQQESIDYMGNFKKLKQLKPYLNVARYYISWYQISKKSAQEMYQNHELVH